MDAESITMMLNAWILAFRKLFEDIGLDRVIRKRLRKALVFKYDSLNQNVLYTGKKSWIANRLREIVASAPINR